MRLWGALLCLGLMAFAAPASSAVQYERVSVSSRERGANEISLNPQITADGTKVVFFSSGSNLVKGTAGQGYLRNVTRGTTAVATRSSKGAVANKYSSYIRISPNGRYVAFCSVATNLVKPDRFEQQHPIPDQDKYTDVFVRDLDRGVTRRASTNRRGGMANDYSCYPEVSNDGDVVFQSTASNLVAKDTNKAQDVFLYDWDKKRVRRVSVHSSGRQVEGDSAWPGISADGRVIAFHPSPALVPDPANASVALHFRGSGRTMIVREPASAGDAGTCGVGFADTDLSRDGRYILIACWHMWNRPEGLRTGAQHLYRYDRIGDRFVQITPISLYEDSGGPVNGWDLTQDGRFASWCSGNVYFEEDQNHTDDVFVAEVESGRMNRVAEGPNEGMDHWCGSELADGATRVVFETAIPFTDADDNGTVDIYLAHDPL